MRTISRRETIDEPLPADPDEHFAGSEINGVEQPDPEAGGVMGIVVVLVVLGLVAVPFWAA